MSKLTIVRHLMGGPLEHFSTFGKKAVIGAELVMCTAELTHAMAFSLGYAILAVACLGIGMVLLETVAWKPLHRLVAAPESPRPPASPKPRPSFSLALRGMRRRWPRRSLGRRSRSVV